MKPVVKMEIPVFLDSGLQKIFVPLAPPREDKLPKNAPDNLKNAFQDLQYLRERFQDDDIRKKSLEQLLQDIEQSSELTTDYKFVKARLGKKTWHIRNGAPYSLEGLWLLIETNTSRQDNNISGVQGHDRGYFYQSDCLTKEEKEAILEEAKRLHREEGRIPYASDKHPSPYIGFQDNTSKPLGIYVNRESGKEELLREKEELLGGWVSFELNIKKPNGKTREVDLVLDLGNTRTAGLMFAHDGEPCDPTKFKQSFKILRIKPDPNSGEYDTINDVEAGIAQSWFVLHELDHQKYHPLNDHHNIDKELIEYEYDAKIKKESNRVLGFIPIGSRTIVTEDSKVIKRIPQMFTQLSPLLLGDQAERQFNFPYAKKLIEEGANLQQSSPKRYYWDDTQGTVYWNMLLNEWDPAYEVNPKTELPTLQGEMLRFIQDNGEVVDLTKDLSHTKRPSPFPDKPLYPKQTTLTWFLLKLLETAYAQSNSSYSKGGAFIPHRLKKVLVTYPSGWTSKEISLYHQRCQQALDIFSHTSVYHGLENTAMRLEMVSKAQTPDEAVASQLPFVFSEIIRYPDQTTDGWLKLCGKIRDGEDSVRIMNFDIGGGTTDISIVEYTDTNRGASYVSMNSLTTALLFKDGRSVAGDELMKRIIEKYVFGSIMRTRPKLESKLRAKFTQPFDNPADQARRNRVVRTCLIPLATYCLANLGEEGSLEYSAQDAGISHMNWMDLLEFLEIEQADLPRDISCVNCEVNEVNNLIEELFGGLFQNCSMFAAAFDVDLLIFSGKPSELPYMRTLARKYIPIDDSRVIFARGYNAGYWYPFTDEKGNILDAKTVTVVGAALFYALSSGMIYGWSIETKPAVAERNEWGDLQSMKGTHHKVFMAVDQDEATVPLLPNTILGRRQNVACNPEPVYKFICKKANHNQPVPLTLKRQEQDGSEELVISAVGDGVELEECELKLWPSENVSGLNFWQEQGVFNIG